MRKFYLSLGRLRKFEPPRELDLSYMRTEVPEPVPLHFEVQDAVIFSLYTDTLIFCSLNYT